MSGAIERKPWDSRPWLLAALGGAAGLIVHAILGPQASMFGHHPGAARTALAIFVAVAALLTGFTLERDRWRWATGFALASATIVALIFWWSGAPDDWSSGDGWRFFCAFLAVAIAAPLFQAARDAGAARFDYAEVHGHAWTNVVLWCASWAFAGLVFLLAWLLSSLFELIHIELLKRLLEKDWFDRLLFGAAFGGALGLLRERDRIVRPMLGVVIAVLRVLAPVLGAGLALFLLSLPFTGLSSLWEATRSATPVVLSCMIAALILANGVIGHGESDAAKARLLRWGGIVLSAVLLPLALIAVFSTATRIAQHGLSVDRLWAVTFIAVASAYGLAYLVALLRGRGGWAEHLRGANLRLAFGVCGLALFLALPVLSFNAIATRDQLARLARHQVSPAQFDWAALGFDFGPPGKRALAQLAHSNDAKTARYARDTLRVKSRWEVEVPKARVDADARRVAASTAPIIVRPDPTPVPAGLRDLIFGNSKTETYLAPDPPCDPKRAGPCLLYWRAGGDVAVAVQDPCFDEPPARGIAKPRCIVHLDTFRLTGGRWESTSSNSRALDLTTDFAAGDDKMTKAQERASLIAEREAFNRGDVEVRTVTRRQLFVGGKPVNGIFE